MKEEFKDKFSMVEVAWFDASSDVGWKLEHEETNTVSLCHTCGYLTFKDKDRISIAASVSSFGELAEVLTIPRSGVQEIKYLTYKKGK